MTSDPRPLSRRRLALLFAGSAAAVAAVVALLFDIAGKREEALHYPMLAGALSDDHVEPAVWGVSFPSQYDRFQKMAAPGTATPYGGGVPYSKLIRSPALTRLWAGYPFAVDFNEERSHYFAEVDQIETKRNDTAWLNDHGFPAFKGQPGACMNCHSGWAPSLIREMGWDAFNQTPYVELKAKLISSHGDGMAGHALGSACADCHTPNNLQLRVTRPAYIQAMVKRGYEADPSTGIKGTHQEMRGHVCQQCHVEYYISADTKTLTFPWTDWPKDTPFDITMLESYYLREAARPGGFKSDWTHPETGAAMLKAQHPETELYASSIHAQSGVSCVDCHMPYRREGALKVTDHFIASPLLDVRAACGTCHPMAETQLTERVSRMQNQTANQLREAEGSIMALITDVAAARALLVQARAAGTTDAAFAAQVDAVLAEPRQAHRRASFRWDFIASENSMGFHSPAAAARTLGSVPGIARRWGICHRRLL